MVDDIVERLRRYADWQALAGYFSDDLTEAADEIERLRAALERIAQCPIPLKLPGRVELWSLAVQMQETARAALAGEASDDVAT
tara:strand:+ start:265 stop:516 length:252 start_codon:yes stop_codon:yes gene_type:complete